VKLRERAERGEVESAKAIVGEIEDGTDEMSEKTRHPRRE
jgi:hypothetical protein